MAGRSLDDLAVTFSWRDLWVVLRRWQKTPGTAFSEAAHGHPVVSLDTQYQAGLFDLLSFANWQRQGRKGAPRPKPVTRPWEKPKGRVFGDTPIPAKKFSRWWSRKKV